MRVLLSIKPEFAFKIFDGIKKFEFRKVIFKKPEIKTVIVYASSPVKRVIGEFEIDDIITSSPKDLWETTKLQSGITEDFFYEYFANREIAHAIKIKETKKYNQPLCIKEDFNVFPPQSYVYL
ncbi:ASCH domain-containing protein [Seonamhaeicola sp.]|uniref:ASCH domain-containing protein n=1 Tax=Seonamhaeicola sp. TaxID=1912245 RepID=UPI0026034597|nr:ASCH domain-containing protein [Seonamhaeicola sp.]